MAAEGATHRRTTKCPYVDASIHLSARAPNHDAPTGYDSVIIIFLEIKAQQDLGLNLRGEHEDV